LSERGGEVIPCLLGTFLRASFMRNLSLWVRVAMGLMETSTGEWDGLERDAGWARGSVLIVAELLRGVVEGGMPGLLWAEELRIGEVMAGLL
jgi:hypothetical protein